VLSGQHDQFGSRVYQLISRLKQQSTHRSPVIEVDEALVLTERKIVQRDLRIRMRAKQLSSLEADCPIAERSAFRADRYNPDILHAGMPSNLGSTSSAR
jgi:hypothetical protein